MDKKLVDFVKDALCEYEQQIEGTALKPSTKDTYIGHAREFVRWLEGKFTPGSGLRTP